MYSMERKQRIFISFSFWDAEFATALANYLKSVISETNLDLYCVALNNNINASKYGTDFADDFMKKVNECDVFIPLLSLNYKKSISSILELGAAIGANKTIAPLILPGCKYSDFNDIYNLRNRDYYSIADSDAIKKLLNLLNDQIKFLDVGDLNINKFVNHINNIAQEYIVNILEITSFSFSCDLYETYDEYVKFIEKIKPADLLECSVIVVHKNAVQLCNFYLRKGCFLSDFKKSLDVDLKLQKYHIGIID